MKVPVDKKRTIITFIIADLAFAVILFLSCINLFVFQRWNVVQFAIIGLFVGVSVIMLILSLTRNFYVIEKKYLVVVRSSKNMFYNYEDVVYIDKEQTERRRVLVFYTNKGHVRYLPFDKEGKIYQIFLQRCHNLLDKEQLKQKYPNIKL